MEEIQIKNNNNGVVEEVDTEWTVLTMEDLPKILEINTKSFIDDQYIKYMFHELTPEQRLPLVQEIQKAFIKQTVNQGASYCIGDKSKDGIKSLILMLPPQVPWPEDLWDIYVQKQKNTLLNQLNQKDTYDRFIALEEFFSEKFCQHDAIEGYYLLILSTDPEFRGQGLASKLLNKLFEKVDREGHSIYLECTNSNLKKFYNSMGFEGLETVQLPVCPSNIDQQYVPNVTFFKRPSKKPINN